MYNNTECGTYANKSLPAAGRQAIGYVIYIQTITLCNTTVNRNLRKRRNTSGMMEHYRSDWSEGAFCEVRVRWNRKIMNPKSHGYRLEGPKDERATWRRRRSTWHSSESTEVTRISEIRSRQDRSYTLNDEMSWTVSDSKPNARNNNNNNNNNDDGMLEPMQ